MMLEQINKLTQKIDGWLTEKEGRLLYRLAKNCRGRGAIVEIGSWKGRSTVWLGKGSMRGSRTKIYAIDPHTGSSEHLKENGKVWTFEEFKDNIKKAKVNQLIIPLVETSKKAAKNFSRPVELIFIDGAHEYQAVLHDFELWFQKVIEGGVMAFHDTTNRFGPGKVVKDLVFQSKYFKNVGIVDSITFAQKVKENSAKDRLRNKYLLSLKTSRELAAKLRLSRIRKAIGIRKA